MSAQKGHKHTRQLNLLCRPQLNIYSSNKRKGSFRSPVEWNLPGPRQSPRKVPPTAAETEQASTSVGERWCFVRGERGSEDHQSGAVSKYLSVGVWDTFVHCSTVTSLYLLVYHLWVRSRAPASAETASL